MIAKLVAALGLCLAASTAAHATVVISNAATKNMSCSAGACAPTAKNAVLNAGDLQGMLASFDVTITTGSGAAEIHIYAPVTWTSASRLTLDAKRGVSIKAAVVSEGTGGMTIVTNDGGTGGDLTFVSSGAISFWDNSSSLIVNGNSYTLVSDIAGLASDVAAHPAGFYALAKDHDAKSDGAYTRSPVPTTLTGAFEGLGHTISNLTIDTKKDWGRRIGLFAEIDGIARDIALTGADIVCGRPAYTGLLAGVNTGKLTAVSAAGHIGCLNADFIGGLVGSNFASATITDASANVTLTGARNGMGGLAGQNAGTISDALAAGSITGGGFSVSAGGIAGRNDALIEDSHSSVTVNIPQGYAAGGIAGQSATIERCSATGDVTAEKAAGGIAGAFGIIDSSFATGKVTAEAHAGGILGTSPGVSMVTNSYATGAVSVTGAHFSRVGGLAGDFEKGNSIETSWSSGAVTGGGIVGGAVGVIEKSTAASVYWDLDTSGVSNPAQGAGSPADFPGIAGLTTAQFRSGLPAGFDPAIWAESAGINNGYPYLIANPPQ